MNCKYTAMAACQIAIISLLQLIAVVNSDSLIDDIVKDRDERLPQMPENTPSNSTNKEPLRVYVGMFIQSISNFRQKEMMYVLDIYFRMSWIDHRLQHDRPFPLKFHDRASLSKIWRPDLYFPNTVSAKMHDVTTPNVDLYIEPNGTVAHSIRVTLDVSCNMHLADFPMDHHICTLQIMSYGENSSSMDLAWFSNKAIASNPNIQLPQFEIKSFTLSRCDLQYNFTVTETGFREGISSCLLLECHLERALGFHLLQTYAPTGLIVMMSWVSFWIDRNAVPARITLSFTTLLTLFTQGAGIRHSLPPVSYSKAIDYWFGMCIFFVIAALLEFALINSIMRKSALYLEVISKDKRTLVRGSSFYKLLENSTTATVRKNPPMDDAGELSEEMKAILIALSTKSSHRALFIDQASRVIFPLSFGLFSLIYWWRYCI